MNPPTRTLAVSVLWLVVPLLMFGCGGEPETQSTPTDQTSEQRTSSENQSLSGEIRVAGSSTVYPITTAVAEEFRRNHNNVSIPVSSTGTGGGFSNFFCEGKTDINNASRPIKIEEVEHCNDNGINPVEMQIAKDALTVVVNPDASWVECMTVDELRHVWKPNGAKQWADVRPGWPEEDFELYGAASTSGTFDYFTEVIMGEEDTHRSDYQATEHDNTIVQAVSGSNYAMGYFGFAYYSQNQDRVKAVAVDNGNGCVKPGLETAQSGKYQPLSRPLFIYVTESSLKKPHIRAFVKYYVKQSSKDLITQVGYVPVPESVMFRNLGLLAEDEGN